MKTSLNHLAVKIFMVTMFVAMPLCNIGAQTTVSDSMTCKQFDKSVAEFQSKINIIGTSKTPNYKSLSAVLNDFIDKYDKLPLPLQQKYNWVSTLYYNSACFNARSGNKKKPLTISTGLPTAERRAMLGHDRTPT